MRHSPSPLLTCRSQGLEARHDHGAGGSLLLANGCRALPVELCAAAPGETEIKPLKINMRVVLEGVLEEVRLLAGLEGLHLWRAAAPSLDLPSSVGLRRRCWALSRQAPLCQAQPPHCWWGTAASQTTRRCSLSSCLPLLPAGLTSRGRPTMQWTTASGCQATEQPGRMPAYCSKQASLTSASFSDFNAHLTTICYAYVSLLNSCLSTAILRLKAML